MLSERVRGQAGVRFRAIWFRCCGGTRKALAALCLGLGAEDAPFAIGWETGRQESPLAGDLPQGPRPPAAARRPSGLGGPSRFFPAQPRAEETRRRREPRSRRTLETQMQSISGPRDACTFFFFSTSSSLFSEAWGFSGGCYFCLIL